MGRIFDIKDQLYVELSRHYFVANDLRRGVAGYRLERFQIDRLAANVIDLMALFVRDMDEETGHSRDRRLKQVRSAGTMQ